MFDGFARARAYITTNVFLRRISRDLHRANELAEMRLAIEHPAAFKAYKQNKGGTAKFAEISVADPAAWDTAWRESHPEPEGDDLTYD